MQPAITSIRFSGRSRFNAHLAMLCLLALGCWGGAGSAWAGGTMYRCAGKSVIYTDQSWAASRAGCRALSGGPLLGVDTATPTRARTSVSAVAHVTPATALAGVPTPAAAERGALRVAPLVQSVRDQERKRILEEELAQEQARLSALGETLKQKQLSTPAVEWVALRQSSARSESNVQALQRELSRIRP
jgi:hypothetical protein